MRGANWWRRGESESSCVLKTRKLLIFRNAKNARSGKIALNWNVSGTRIFQSAGQFREEDLPSPASASSFQMRCDGWGRSLSDGHRSD
jgi:hypothetical protein